MAVGNQATAAAINASLSALAVNLRDVCDQIRNFQTYITQLGNVGLEAAGYTAADAATVQTVTGELANVAGVYFGTVQQGAGVYFGTVQQGGNGGTGAVPFSFDNALAAIWGGQ